MWNRHDQIIRKIIVGDDWVIKLLFEHCKVGLPCCIPTAVQEEDYILLSLQELNFYNVRIVWSKHWETRGVVVAFYLFYGISSGCGQRFSWHSVRFPEFWYCWLMCCCIEPIGRVSKLFANLSNKSLTFQLRNLDSFIIMSARDVASILCQFHHNLVSYQDFDPFFGKLWNLVKTSS